MPSMTIQKSTEPDAFTAFERAGWSSVISGYERVLGPVTAQTVDATLRAARLAEGDRVLDVCTGHGVLASAAAKMGATARGLDFAPEVVAIARRNAPDLDFDEGDAQQLPYPAESFDKVICGYGIIHLPDPQRALAEMHRRRRMRPSNE
jgi:ubiquinone/menaquinone biosynthesis C-methylase UbiE